MIMKGETLMIKKILILSLLLIFTTVNTFSAAEPENLQAEQNFIENTVDVTGIYKAPPGESVTAVISKESDINTDSLITVYEYTLENADGRFSFSIPMSENLTDTGEYILYLKGKLMTETAFVTFQYKNPLDFTKDMLSDINNAEKNALIGKIFEYSVFLNIDKNVKNEEWFDEEKAADLLWGLKTKPFETVSEVKDSFCEAMALSRINKSETGEEIYNLFAEYEFLLGDDIKYYDNIGYYTEADTDELKNEKIKEIKTNICQTLVSSEFASAKALSDALVQSALLYETSNAESPGVLHDLILKDYSEKISIPQSVMTAYENLNDKLAVFKLMKGKSFDSVDKIVSEFKTAVDKCTDTENEPKNNTSPSRGNGGGGGRGGSFTVPGNTGLPANNETDSSDQTSTENQPDKKVFEDIDEAEWAKESILYLYEKKIVSGYNGKFNPSQYVTREEFVKMLVLAANIYDESAECGFSDIPSDNWAYPYISSAVKNEIVSGMGNGEFGLGQSISRQDTAVIASKLLKSDPNVSAAEFSDSDEISEYAKGAVAAMQNIGIISGMDGGRFAPKEPLTRAQAAKIICMLITKGGIAQ